jgi:hypothetical protein
MAGICDPADGSCIAMPKAEGAPCDDGSVCTVLDRCVSSACTGAFTVTCNDADPCTTDGCEAVAGCVYTPVGGFPSLTCTFERDRIPTACPAGLPRSIQARLAKAEALAAKASDPAGKPRRVRKLLGKIGKALRQASRQARVKTKRGKVPTGCGDVLAVEIDDIRARNDALRATVTPGRASR